MTRRLFVYETLAPERPNGHILPRIPGKWEATTVNGHVTSRTLARGRGLPTNPVHRHGQGSRLLLFPILKRSRRSAVSSDRILLGWPDA